MDEDPFSGWGLRSVEITDQANLSTYFTSLSEPLSDYTFSQIYTWRNSLRILWRIINGHLCVFANGTGDLTLLLPPIGDGDSDRALAGAFELMDDYNAQHKVPDRSRVEYASEELLARLDRSRLDVQPMGTDYLYDTARMIDLAGGDLASKRQAKNRFLRNYAHRVELYDPARHLTECLTLLNQWKAHQDAQHSAADSTNALKRQKESLATELAMRHAGELGLAGMVVYVRDAAGVERISGFTFGEPLGHDQSSIVIEKTDLEIKGLAQFIFSEFTRTAWADRPLVNVGDDWGLETLAWTKASYRPVKRLQKYWFRQLRAAMVAGGDVGTAGPLDAVFESITPIPPPAPAPVAPLLPLLAESPAPAATLIRPAHAGDLSAAIELETACFTAYSLSARQLGYLVRCSNAVFHVATQNEAVVGEGIALLRHHRRGLSGRIYSLAVNPACRGQGIGQKLLSSLLSELTQRGVRRVYLEVESTNVAAIRLYEANGFRSIGHLPDYYGEGRSALHMMCEIPIAKGLFDTDRRAA